MISNKTDGVMRLFLFVSFLMCFFLTAVFAQEINWYTTDQGGGTSSNGGVSVTGVIGQIDTKQMEGGSITISGGYLPLSADLIFENPFD